jgi:hypothetical protein
MGEQLDMFPPSASARADARLSEAQAQMRRDADARARTRGEDCCSRCGFDIRRLGRELGLTDEFLARYRRPKGTVASLRASEGEAHAPSPEGPRRRPPKQPR